MNILALGAQAGSLRLSGTVDLPARAASLGIRPEHIALTEPGKGHCDASVEVVEYLGADSFLFADAGAAGRMTVRIAGESELKPGAKIGLEFDPGQISFFDSEGLRV